MNDQPDQDLKLRLARVPYRPAPPKLMARLKHEYAGAPWYFSWKIAGTFALAVGLIAIWFINRTPDVIDLEPILASHARYRAESLVPPADMVASDFSAHLVSYRSGDHE